jgi:hypothetical protein
MYEVAAEDGYLLAAAARGQGNGTWSTAEAGYLLWRVVVLARLQLACWVVWVGTAAVCAAASLGVIALVLSRARLRAQPFNHFVIGLSIPDLVFSGLSAIARARHGSRGRWSDGDAGLGDGRWLCDFQAWYLVFGVAGSMWVKLAVTRELDRLTTAIRLGRSYELPSVGAVYARVGAALALAAAIAWIVAYGERAWRHARAPSRAGCR